MSLAIDREALVARLGGSPRALKGFFPPGVVGYPETRASLRYSPPEARALLAQAGYGKGFSAELVYAPGGSGIVDIIVPMLAQVGIELRPRSLVWSSLLPLWRGARLPLFMGSWWFSSGDASLFLKECLGTRPAGVDTGWNPGYSDPQMDALIREDFLILGTPARARHSEILSEYLVEQMPLVPLLNRADVYAVGERVNWKPRLDGRLLGSEMGLR
jgi:peptide/nickel transport system substrate-binding protein